MNEPEKRPPETQFQDPAITGLTPLESLDQYRVQPLAPAPQPYTREPLFNKKVMAVWALGALAVWFAFTVVLPAVFDAVKTSVAQTIQEVETDGGVRIKIERDKNGKIFNITRVETVATPSPAPAPPASGAPAVTPTPPADPVPPRDAAKAPETRK